MSINKKSSIPIYIQIQELIIKQIQDGTFPVGTRVPSEKELARVYNISRMTARKVLDGLVSRGLLYRQPGKGTYVSDSFMTYRLSTLFSFSKTLGEQGYSVSTIVLDQTVIPVPALIASKLGLSSDKKVVYIRRLRIVNERPAAIHVSYLPHPEFAQLLELDLSTNSLLHAIEAVGRLRVVCSLDSVSAESASFEEAEKLDIPSGSPVLVVKGVAYSERGSPVRYTHAIYRGDLFRLEIANSVERGISLLVAAGHEDE